MSLPVFYPITEVSSRLPPGRSLTLARLCELAGISCRVSGAPAQRRIILGTADKLSSVKKAGALSDVWVGVPEHMSGARRAFEALGVLAYAVFDYGARECLRGLPAARPRKNPGRKPSGRAMTPAERQRRKRQRGRERE